jgi:ribosomal protein L11 methyltransferase
LPTLDRSIGSVPALEDGASSIAILDTDEQAARRAAYLVAETFAADEVAVSLVDTGGGRWRAIVYFRAAANAAALRDLVAAAAGANAAAALRFEQVAARDWVRDSLAGLKPVSAGRFVVHGAHDRAAIPINKIGIEIEAALAFGTGHHGTTRGCLLALDRICKARHENIVRILDLGTGTGVLAITSARAFRRRILATDIDRNAVHVARTNAVLNATGPLVTVIKADGVAAPALRGRYDLVFANILLRPLQRLAAPLTRRLAPGGRLVLSGIMTAQANAAIAAYHRLTLERRVDVDGWTTLIFRRGNHRRSCVAGRGSAS